MFIDASALTAILVSEDDADDLAARLEQAANRATSPMIVWETAVAIARLLKIPPTVAGAKVLEYLDVAQITLTDVAADSALTALDAFERYGKGRHPAQLNFGDCFAYACARDLNLPLLFKGQDFSQTDIAVA